MNRRFFYMLLFIAATGFAAGVFFEVSLDAESKGPVLEFLSVFFSEETQSPSAGFSVLQNFCSGLPVLLLCVFLPHILLLLVPFFLLFFMQSVLYGFSAALLTEACGAPSGFLQVLTAVLPSALLRTLLFAGYASASFSMFRPRHCREIHRKKALRNITGLHAVFFAAGSAALLIISLLQAVLQQITL